MSEIALYPVCVFEDRYGGTYSGGAWVAVAECDKLVGRQLGVLMGPTRFSFAFEGTHASDPEAGAFGSAIVAIPWIGVGPTPDEAIKNLRMKMDDASREHSSWDHVV